VSQLIEGDDEAPRTPVRAWPRRAVLAGTVAAVGGAGAAIAARHAGDGASAGGRPPTDAADRATAPQPAAADGFAARDASYASARTSGRVGAPADAGPTLVFPTAAEAAAGTRVEGPTLLASDRPVLHLLRRATWGPTPALLVEVEAVGIDAWLDAQLDPATIADDEADAVVASVPLGTADQASVRREVQGRGWAAATDVGRVALARQVWGRRHLLEVMVDFWSDHLHVATPSGASWDVGGSYHHDVIRAHALGSFSDMLVASARHPAMLRFLTAEDSTKESVNENYGREVLELHTVGVAAGYTEQDVRTSAHILTGRTVERGNDPGAGAFRYDPEMHWVGPVSILGFSHANASGGGGLEVGDAYLRHLARREATATTIARKLAVRFVSDTPPPALVDRLAAAYLDGDTAVVPVLDTLFRSAEFWAAVGRKTRRPLENIVAAARVLEVRPTGDAAAGLGALYNIATRAGHRPLAWPAPDGYPDVAGAWRSAGGLVAVWNSHRMLAGDWEDQLSNPDPFELAGGAGAAGPLVDNLCDRLVFQGVRPRHREALVTFLGGEDTPVTRRDLAVSTVALVLDAPYHALR
jgi:uncharacterized protein (DUF1800 family)